MDNTLYLGKPVVLGKVNFTGYDDELIDLVLGLDKMLNWGWIGTKCLVGVVTQCQVRFGL